MSDEFVTMPPIATRRRLLQAGAGALALGALPGVMSRRRAGAAGFDWKRFKGEKIEVLLVKSPRGDLLTKYHKEFEDMTGINVGSEMIPEQQQRQKAVIEFNSGNPSFDVIALVVSRAEAPVRQEQLAHRPAADASPTSRWPIPNLDFADFAKGGLNYAVEPDGRINSLPLNLDPVGRLLQQGAVRRQGHRVSEDVRRDARRRREAQRPGQGRLRVCRRAD